MFLNICSFYLNPTLLNELFLQLLEATQVGNSDDVTDLIGKGADTEFKNKVRRMLSLFSSYHDLLMYCCVCTLGISQYGYTALISAAGKGHADCVRLLLDAGADKNAFDKVRVDWFCRVCGGAPHVISFLE
jgi:hypothetical protein